MGGCQLDGALQRFNPKGLVVDVLGFDFQFLLTGFADPVVFSIDEGVVVDTFAVIFGAEITLHYEVILPHLRFIFLSDRSEHN